MNKKELLDILVNEYSYTKQSARVVLDKIKIMDQEIREAFEKYIIHKEKPEISVSNYSYEQLIQSYDMNPIAAFLTLDWLKREPKAAERLLKKGFDSYKKTP
jgi:hypothetical protein